MIYSIFFCAGIVAGAALWSVSTIIAKRIAETAYKTQLLKLKQDGLIHRQSLEQSIRDITNAQGNGPQLTTRHKEVLAEELSQVLTKRPRTDR